MGKANTPLPQSTQFTNSARSYCCSMGFPSKAEWSVKAEGRIGAPVGGERKRRRKGWGSRLGLFTNFCRNFCRSLCKTIAAAYSAGCCVSSPLRSETSNNNYPNFCRNIYWTNM